MDDRYKSQPVTCAGSGTASFADGDETGPARPSAKAWFTFSGLLVATLLTAYLAQGVLFSISLILILGAHEFGHYWAIRRNRVKATLPYFIPAPPVFIAGTFGAFIQIKGHIPNRRALMEIGAAGPIAGFIVAVPTLIIGLLLSHTTPAPGFYGLALGDSIILKVLYKIILGVDPLSTELAIILHPIAFAGWFGLLVTTLNLFPIGQLDGGHIIYSMFRIRHGLVAKLFFVFMLPLGYFWPGWLLWALMIALMGFKHAPVIDDCIMLEQKHKMMGLTCIIIFVITFVPIPFEFLR